MDKEQFIKTFKDEVSEEIAVMIFDLLAKEYKRGYEE